MNKSPVAVGFALIMGISVVFAFDRVKPIEEMPVSAIDEIIQNQTSVPAELAASQPDMEANILTDEAPLILDAGNELLAQVVLAYDADVELVADYSKTRSLKDALADMQIALAALEQEAVLTHQAVALWEQNFRQ